MINKKIGVKIGRLTNYADGLEKFPIRTWKKELFHLNRLGISVVEWSISNEGFYKNPIFDKKLNSDFNVYKSKYNLHISSIVFDFIIQTPFWKFTGSKRKILEKKFYDCLEACSKNNIKKIIFPIIDNSRFVENYEQKEVKSFFIKLEDYLETSDLQILIEADFNPEFFKNFISDLNNNYFKICYDTGNSSGNKFDIEKEFNFYGDYVSSIHIKDKNINNKSVLLGSGMLDFDKFFNLINDINYQGNFVFETYKKKPLLKHLEYQLKLFKDKYNKFNLV